MGLWSWDSGGFVRLLRRVGLVGLLRRRSRTVVRLLGPMVRVWSRRPGLGFRWSVLRDSP